MLQCDAQLTQTWTGPRSFPDAKVCRPRFLLQKKKGVNILQIPLRVHLIYATSAKDMYRITMVDITVCLLREGSTGSCYSEACS